MYKSSICRIIVMKTVVRDELFTILTKEYGYSKKSAYAILDYGTRKPRYSVMVDLHQRGIIPFTAWLDIKSYLNGNSKDDIKSTTKESEKV